MRVTQGSRGHGRDDPKEKKMKSVSLNTDHVSLRRWAKAYNVGAVVGIFVGILMMALEESPNVGIMVILGAISGFVVALVLEAFADIADAAVGMLHQAVGGPIHDSPSPSKAESPAIP
jgi:hypothetical protein